MLANAGRDTAFCVVNRGCEVEFHLFSTHAGRSPPLLSFFQAENATCVFLGQLYYRCELLAELGSSSFTGADPRTTSNDAELAIAMYRQYGIEGLERLEGDFALVIWDVRESRLVAIRDPMGGHPLFWTDVAGALLLSTTMRPLLKWLPHLALDLDYLADYLLVNGSQSELPSERCVYQGIHRLLPGSWLSVTIPDRQKQRRIYWNWLDHLIDPGTDRLEEVSDQYRDRLMQAVRERLRGQTASHLSGGMDSTAIALLALKWISLGMGTAPLHTITLVFERLPTLASETPYIDAALEHAHGILPHRIPADGLLDFDIFTDPPLHDEPYPGLWRLGMDRATIEAVDQIGAATLLTGLGADEILDRQPLHITDLLRQGRFVKAWTEAYQWAHRNRLSLWQVLYPCGLANLFPAWTRLGWGRLFHPHGSLSTDNEWALPPWILPDFARRYGLRARARENARRTYASCRPTALSFALTSILGRVGNAIAWSLATPKGISITHPFLDARVLCLGLGLQVRFTPEPGRLKPILAEAMRGVLPDIIRQRRSKGHFNEVYYLGLSKNLYHLETMIRQAPCDDLGLLDKEVLIHGLQKAALGGAGARPLQHLNVMLAFLKWLGMQPV